MKREVMSVIEDEWRNQRNNETDDMLADQFSEGDMYKWHFAFGFLTALRMSKTLDIEAPL